MLQIRQDALITIVPDFEVSSHIACFNCTLVDQNLAFWERTGCCAKADMVKSAVKHFASHIGKFPTFPVIPCGPLGTQCLEISPVEGEYCFPPIFVPLHR